MLRFAPKISFLTTACCQAAASHGALPPPLAEESSEAIQIAFNLLNQEFLPYQITQLLVDLRAKYNRLQAGIDPTKSHSLADKVQKAAIVLQQSVQRLDQLDTLIATGGYEKLRAILQSQSATLTIYDYLSFIPLSIVRHQGKEAFLTYMHALIPSCQLRNLAFFSMSDELISYNTLEADLSILLYALRYFSRDPEAASSLHELVCLVLSHNVSLASMLATYICDRQIAVACFQEIFEHSLFIEGEEDDNGFAIRTKSQVANLFEFLKQLQPHASLPLLTVASEALFKVVHTPIDPISALLLTLIIPEKKIQQQAQQHVKARIEAAPGEYEYMKGRAEKLQPDFATFALPFFAIPKQ